MSSEVKKKFTGPSPYSQFGLADYVAAAADRSLKAETSRLIDLDADIRPTHISHLALATTNFEAVSDWWQKVLKMEPALDADGMRFMTFDGEHHKVVVFEVDGLISRTQGPPEYCGMHHIAFSYASFEDLAATYLRLKSDGILPYRALSHGTSFAVDYYDPDFNNCELQCSCFPDAPDDRQALDDWLSTGAFNRNPIGVLFNMDEAIKAYEAGVDVAEIVSPYRMRIGDHTVEELKAGKMAPERPKND
jgi:catechol 2,3-dioxygenase-like lactoylglutathione lyase family enzyme